MIFKKLTILSFLFQATVLQTTIDNYAESKRRENVDENLLQKRCELINYEYKLDNLSLARCMKNLTKPGHCPASIYSKQRESLGNMICEEICEGHDYKCPGTQKCCKHNSCNNMVCQEPEDLFYDNNLPPIPKNVIARNLKRKGRTCELSWEYSLMNAHNQSKHFLYIVECRWHFGTLFSPRKLRDWEWIDYEITGHILTYRTSMKRMQARIKLKRGRFYQFRIAIINEHGFKGYSEPSLPFRLHDVATHITDPRPPKEPKNFKITLPKLLPNNSVYAKITWMPNKSDIPVEKYHISWALYIKAENNSLLLNDIFVKEPIHQYEFWSLLPNSMYYIQIQAIAVHGRRRPKSKKVSIFYNTTLSLSNSLDDVHFFHTAPLNNNNIDAAHKSVLGQPRNLINSEAVHHTHHYDQKFQKPSITIKFLPSKKHGLLVRVQFNKDSINENYFLELCPGNFSNCQAEEYEAAKVKKDQIDFSQLKFNKQYTLRLIDTTNQISIINNKNNVRDENEGGYETSNHHARGIIDTKTFKTPVCTEWIKKHPNLKQNIKC